MAFWGFCKEILFFFDVKDKEDGCSIASTRLLLFINRECVILLLNLFIKKIQDGITPFIEPRLEKILKIGLNKKLKISAKFKEINNCDLIFVSVGTPQLFDGSIDLSNIKSVAKTLGKEIPKSTKKTFEIYFCPTIDANTSKKTKNNNMEKLWKKT